MCRRVRLASDPCFELYRRSDERHQAAEFSWPGSSPLSPSLALGRLSVGNSSTMVAIRLHPALSAVPLPIPCSFALVFFGSGLCRGGNISLLGSVRQSGLGSVGFSRAPAQRSKIARVALGRLILLSLSATTSDTSPLLSYRPYARNRPACFSLDTAD